MKTTGIAVGITFLFSAVLTTTCTKDEASLSQNGENPSFKGASSKTKIIHVEASGDISGVTDFQHIFNALHEAGSGDIVQLGNGTFYLHKSLTCWDFNGTLRGMGKNNTIIQTAPGIIFDVSESLPLEWAGNWINEGHTMLSFPHHSNPKKRAVCISDLTFIVDEPCTEWIRDIHNEHTIHNNLVPVLVYHESLDRDYSNTIKLDVHFKDLILIGEEDPIYAGQLGTNYSMATGLAAAGAAIGNVIVEEVYVSNASFGLGFHAFNGKNSTILVTESEVDYAAIGLYSQISHTWELSDNTFSNCSFRGIYVDTYGLAGTTSVFKDNLIVMSGGFHGILGVGLDHVQVRDNTFEGLCYTGVLPAFGSYWEIMDNNFCNLSVFDPEQANIILYQVNDCLAKENAGQIVSGPSAGDPSNTIGDAADCDNFKSTLRPKEELNKSMIDNTWTMDKSGQSIIKQIGYR